jgi:Ni/Co efflux regulator RcnB
LSALLEEIPMKKLLVCAAALGLFVTMPAMSASDNNHQGNNHQGNNHQEGTQGTNSHSASGGTHQNAPGGATTGSTHKSNGGGNPQGTMSGNHFLGSVTTGGTHTRTGGANSHGATLGNSFSTSAPSSNNSRVNGMHRNNSAPGNAVFGNTVARQPSINSLRLNVQSSRHFRHGDYRAPQGYQARHWTYGGRLPRSYFVRDYWITDFLMFGLFAPPPDLIWVRVGNDALLVDRYSGDIVQVDYDVFY